MARTLCGIGALLVAAAVAVADSWPAATIKEVFSNNRDWFVRIVPGKSLGDTVGFAGSPKGPYARAEFYRRQSDRSYSVAAETTLANPIAPVQFLVTDRGYLVTLDDWHNYGYGQVVVAYAPDGRRVASYTLKDLFTAEEIARFSHSTSSIQWRTETVYVRTDQQSIYLALDDKGRELVVAAETGAWQQCERRSGLHQCRTTNTGRQWQPFREPALRK